MIKVFLCDDQLIVIEGLRKIIESDPEIKVIGAASNGEELIELLANSKPDLILTDLKMPVMNGIIAIRKIRHDFPNIHVLALTTYDDDEWVFDALQAGAEGISVERPAAGSAHPGHQGHHERQCLYRPQGDPESDQSKRNFLLTILKASLISI